MIQKELEHIEDLFHMIHSLFHMIQTLFVSS